MISARHNASNYLDFEEYICKVFIIKKWKKLGDNWFVKVYDRY